MATEQWLSFKDAVGMIRQHLASSVGRAQAVLRAARTSGEVRHRPDPNSDPVLLTPDDGLISGMDIRPGAMNKGGVTADGRPLGANIKEIFSKDDLLDWLQRQAPTVKPSKAKAPGRRGAPEQYDWNDGFQFMRKELDQRGDPTKPENAVDGWRSNTDVGRAVQAYILKLEGREPDISTVKKRIRPELEEWRKGGKA